MHGFFGPLPVVAVQLLAGGAAITGELSATLGSLAAASTGTVAVSGASAVTLGDLASSSTGAVAVAGAASVTLGDLAVSSAGTAVIAGTVSVTLGALTTVSAGGVVVDADAAPTLDALTVSATGTVAIRGALAVTLGPLTSAMGGEAMYIGVLVPDGYRGEVVGPTYLGRFVEATTYLGNLAATDYRGVIDPEGDDMFSMIVGDRKPDFTTILKNAETGNPIDLTSAVSVTAKLKIGENGTIKTGSASFVASSAGSVTYEWGASDIDDDGICYLRFVVTYSGSKTQTLPSDGSWYMFPVSA